MTPTIILAAIVIIPAALMMVLRVNATLVFLSLCLGDVLVQFVSGDKMLFNLLSKAHSQVITSNGSQNIKIALLILPVILTTIFMMKTIKGNAKLALNILPSAGVGLLGGLLIVPLLPVSVSQQIIDSSLWAQALKGQSIIVGGSAIVCLLVLWLQRPRTGGGEHGHHDKHSKHH